MYISCARVWARLELYLALGSLFVTVFGSSDFPPSSFASTPSEVMPTYTVTVATGNQWFAGTDDYIYITLMGTGQCSERTLLDKPMYNDFERGAVSLCWTSGMLQSCPCVLGVYLHFSHCYAF